MNYLETLTIDNLDVWATFISSPKFARGRSNTSLTGVYGVQKLRGFILDLAITGRITDRDNADDLVQELLDLIKTHNKSGKKNTKDKSQLSSNEFDGALVLNLPSSWKIVRLSDIADVIRGVTYGKLDASNTNTSGYIQLLRGNNIQDVLNFDDPLYIPKKIVNQDQLLRRGDIVIAMSSGSHDLVGKAAQVKESNLICTFGAFCGVVRPKSDSLIDYLALFFKTPLYRKEIASHGKGIGINNLQKSSLLHLEIPIPPIREQNRIVTKVNELMVLCDKLEGFINEKSRSHVSLSSAFVDRLVRSENLEAFKNNLSATLDQFDQLFISEKSIEYFKGAIIDMGLRGRLTNLEFTGEDSTNLISLCNKISAASGLKKSIRKEVKIKNQSQLTDIYEIPKGWTWTKLSELATFENGDRSKNYPSKEKFVKDGNAFINAGHLIDGEIDYSDMNYIDQTTYENLRSGKVREGDILFCLRGSLGKFGVVKRGQFGAIASSLVIIRPFIPDLCEYLSVYFSSSLARDEILKFDNGTAQPNLAGSDLALFMVPLPPLDEQKTIIVKLKSILSMCDKVSGQITKARNLQRKIADVLVEQALA